MQNYYYFMIIIFFWQYSDVLFSVLVVILIIISLLFRSGRIPKLSQHVMQAVAEEEEDEEELSDLPVSSKVCGQDFKAPGRRAKLKPGPRLKRGMPRRGKSRLVTLLASGTEDDDEEEDVEESVLSQEDFPSNLEEENQAFVPMSLRPLPPVNSEVIETMEEVCLCIIVRKRTPVGPPLTYYCYQCACFLHKLWFSKSEFIFVLPFCLY